MVSVFLSHSSKDKPFVRELADTLQIGNEITCWLDEREINYGDSIVNKIGQGIKADFVLLILSPDSIASNWVEEEWSAKYWKQVNEGKVKLVPVLYRDCEIPDLLANKMYVEARTNHPEAFRKIKNLLLGFRPTPPPVVHLPQRSQRFIGREPEIADLRQRLAVEGAIAHIPGMGGQGKTALALEYAQRWQRDFEAVHWLPCEGHRTLTQIAGELTWQLGLKIEGEVDTVARELRDICARKRCLLIFDNVEDETITALLPGGRASALVTTRLRNLRFLRGIPPVQLPLFSEEQCFELFRRDLGEKEVERHREKAAKLFERLGYLPIAIAVASSLILEDVHYTIAELAANLPADTTELLVKAVAALSSNARTLLQAAAVCAPEGFRLGIAAQVAGFTERQALDALQEIHSRSLAEELDRDTRRYRLHALVREAADASDQLRWQHAAIIEAHFRGWEANWRQCSEDMVDWQVAYTWSLNAPPEDVEAWKTAKWLAFWGNSLTERLGRLPEAYEAFERLQPCAASREDQGALAMIYGNQALILQAWGRLDDAMTLHKKVEAICEELGDRAGLQRSYGNQALILQAWGRLDEAMALMERQEAICVELGDRADLHRIYGNQALILQAWGRLDDAMALHKKKEAICVELGDRHSLSRCYGNQAVILQAWGRLDDAMALMEKQEAICVELGDRADLHRVYGNQSLILNGWGRLDEAMALHKKTEAICVELGDRHSLSRCYGNQAVILQAWGRLDDAMALMEKQETICVELGDRAGLQASYGNQALILKAWGRLDDAMALHQKEEVICLELGDRAGLASCYANQGFLAQKRGDREEAHTMLERALAIFTELRMPREIEIVQGGLDRLSDSTSSPS